MTCKDQDAVTAFWDVRPCCLVNIKRCYLQSQGR